MKVIFALFDSLNRHSLPPYGGTSIAPNFARLAERTATFDTSYVCSMPCMPARRDLHTGRPNFPHRGWGPLEPYDDSLPQLLGQAGVYTHLISDHYHYWEEGGSNYHTKYNTWDIVRGQEGDPWIPRATPPERPETVDGRNGRMPVLDSINRQAMPHPHQQPISQVFARGHDFIERHASADNWFLQLETFDPHEPFFTHRHYKDLYPEHYRNYRGRPFDWPPYREVGETPEEIEHARHEYLALVSMCDEKLGDLLDQMDRLNLWEDTMLVVATDHGFLLGEHEAWGKCWLPFYEEIARTPFFVWDPRCRAAGDRRKTLVQPAIDLPPTVLRAFDQEPTERMTGRDLAATIANDDPVRETAVFGMFGAHINITDGRHVYMRGNPPGADNRPLYEYTLMPANMRKPFDLERFQEPFGQRTFDFSKGCHLMKIHSVGHTPGGEKTLRTFEHLLFDLEKDPEQKQPIEDPEIEARFRAKLDKHLRDLDAPTEQWERLGLPKS